MKKAFAIFVMALLVILSSGCLQNDMCKNIEKEMAKKNITCHCTQTDFMPEEYKNLSAKPECACLCYSNGVWINTTIAVADYNET